MNNVWDTKIKTQSGAILPKSNTAHDLYTLYTPVPSTQGVYTTQLLCSSACRDTPQIKHRLLPLHTIHTSYLSPPGHFHIDFSCVLLLRCKTDTVYIFIPLYHVMSKKLIERNRISREIELLKYEACTSRQKEVHSFFLPRLSRGYQLAQLPQNPRPMLPCFGKTT